MVDSEDNIFSRVNCPKVINRIVGAYFDKRIIIEKAFSLGAREKGMVKDLYCRVLCIPGQKNGNDPVCIGYYLYSGGVKSMAFN